ncbi:hypothetical protein FSC37_13710 [Piscinibacter aquaticus]|uniref:Uncharacterized protein n=1 Tax=Piscinibacter aquaticus TaxID=392597 RepID=A0A5C6U3E7_9BURK|nr:hypothetical protein FSC37_13710 [Piscinibacter aquaticus]
MHLNVGVAKPREERRVFTAVIAGEHEVWRRTSLFAEIARDREGTLQHAGVRHWIKRERPAVDSGTAAGAQRRGARQRHRAGHRLVRPLIAW